MQPVSSVLMWAEATIALRAINPQLTGFWRRYGVWLFLMVLVLTACYVLASRYPNPSDEERIALGKRMALAFFGAGIKAAVSILILALFSCVLRALDASLPQSTDTGWLSPRSLFLVLQRLALPLIILATLSQMLLIFALDSLIVSRSLAQCLYVLRELPWRWLPGMSNLFAQFLWFSALVAVRPRALTRLLWLYGLLVVVNCVLIPAILPFTGLLLHRLAPAERPGSHFVTLQMGMVSVAALSLWVVSERYRWRVASRLSFMLQFAVAAATMPAMLLRLLPSGIVVGDFLLAAYLYVSGALSTVPVLGATEFGWLLELLWLAEDYQGMLANTLNTLLVPVWLGLLYAIVWGILLRSDRQQIENTFGQPLSARTD